MTAMEKSSRILSIMFVLLYLMLWFQEVEVARYFSADQKVDSEQGLLVYSASTSEGEQINYERPVVLLPIHMKEGQVHTSQRRFVRLVNGEKRDVGAHYFEAELIGKTAFQQFDDCLKIRRYSVRMDFKGTQLSEKVIEWYAKGVGLVKSEGERLWQNAKGVVVRSERIE